MSARTLTYGGFNADPMARAQRITRRIGVTHKYRGIRVGTVPPNNHPIMLGNVPRPVRPYPQWDPYWGILFEERRAPAPEMTVMELCDWADANWRNEDGKPWRLTFSDADLITSFDELPWEIHDIDDLKAREIVTLAYKQGRL